METRPPLTARLTGTELRRWYWLHSELIDFARTLGVATAGGKGRADRAGGVRAGRPAAATRIGRPALGGRSAAGRAADRRHGDSDRSTLLAAVAGVLRRPSRCRLPLRRAHARVHLHRRAHPGRGTRVLAYDSAGTPRPSAATEISAQFELNRFTRAWHQTHPGRPRAELLAAWAHYRSLPVEAQSRASVP